jgi:hypothetical protein
MLMSSRCSPNVGPSVSASCSRVLGGELGIASETVPKAQAPVYVLALIHSGSVR